jgi:hypothetical protein
MTEGTFNLTQFAERLARLESELNRKPALTCFLDADLDHNLCALRLMGILPRESASADSPTSELVTKKLNRHGGSRPRAGRKKSRPNADRQRAYRRRVAALRKSSL